MKLGSLCSPKHGKHRGAPQHRSKALGFPCSPHHRPTSLGFPTRVSLLPTSLGLPTSPLGFPCSPTSLFSEVGQTAPNFTLRVRAPNFTSAYTARSGPS